MLSPVTLLVAAGAFIGVRSASSSAPTACETELTACLADATCNACLSGPEPTDFCSQRYPWIFTDGSAGEGAGFDYCEATGASNCCDHETKEISNQCLTNSAAIDYWTCVMADEGCFVTDMPCFDVFGWTTEPATLAPAGSVAPITPAPVSVVDLPTPATPETVDFANGAARTFDFSSTVLMVGGLVLLPLFYMLGA